MVESIEARRIIIQLLRTGSLQHERDRQLWPALRNAAAEIRDYLRVIGLELVIDPDEGFAYLRSSAPDPNTPEEEESDERALPRLIPRRQLSFDQSLLLVLLRKRLAEHDLASGDPRCVVQRDEVVSEAAALSPGGTNEAGRADRLRLALKKLEEFGFIRSLEQQGDATYEIVRITKAYVDAQSLGTFHEQLAFYRQHREKPDV